MSGQRSIGDHTAHRPGDGPSADDPPAALVREVQGFFDDFVLAFRAFDGALIAQRYAVPYVAVSTAGALRPFSSREDIAAYFQSVLNAYHHQGCRSCDYSNLTVVAMGSASALVSITWQLLRADTSTVSTWRESYSLVRTAGEGLRIFASVDHAS